MKETRIHIFSRERLKPGIILPCLIFLIALSAFIKDRYSVFDFPLDDAWIHCVYARSFAFGHGFAYNGGQQEAGSTSPLWVMVTAPAHWLDVFGTNHVVIAVKIIGILFALAIILATERIALHLTGSRLVAGIAASLMAIEPRLIFSSLSGMETLLLAAIWAWACAALLSGRFVVFLALLGLAPIARPEGILLLPLSLLVVRDVIRWLRSKWLRIALLILPFMPQLLWSAACMAINGHPLPNTFYIKALPLNFDPIRLLLAFLGFTQHGFPSLWLYIPGLAAIIVFGVVKRNRAVVQCGLSVILVPLTYLWTVVATRRFSTEGYYWTRWLDPASLLLTVPFCVGFALLLTMLLRHSKPGKQRLAYSFVGAFSLICLLISTPAFYKTYMERRYYLSFHSRRIDALNVQMGKWIEKNVPGNAVVAVNDAGAIRYFGNRHTIDLMGLNNAEIAFRKLSPLDAIARADWLAIFPQWFAKNDAVQQLLKRFEARAVTRFKEQDSTPPGQETVKVAYQNKAALVTGSGPP